MSGPIQLRLAAGVPVVAAAFVEVESSADAASSRLSMAIAGLIGLAVIVAISTIVFWRLTRPDSLQGDIGIRWVAPESESPSASTAAPASQAPPSSPAPRAPSSPPDSTPLRPRPADG